MNDMLKKIKSVKYCMMAHPDNEDNSEFADRISDLQEIEDELSNNGWTKIETEVQKEECFEANYFYNEKTKEQWGGSICDKIYGFPTHYRFSKKYPDPLF